MCEEIDEGLAETSPGFHGARSDAVVVPGEFTIMCSVSSVSILLGSSTYVSADGGVCDDGVNPKRGVGYGPAGDHVHPCLFVKHFFRRGVRVSNAWQCCV